MMDKIIRGVMRYRFSFRDEMVKQFVKIKDNPTPTALFFTCIDSRMLPTRFTQTNVGDMFIVRNAGNLIPCATLMENESISTEPASLELACVINKVKHIIVCGHSDCKAMNMLYDLRHSESNTVNELRLSPMKAWLCRHGQASLNKFHFLEDVGCDHPLTFQAETPMKKFVAYVDVDNRFNMTDKLSQINCLQQLQHIASYPFLRQGLEEGSIRIHAMWFDIYTGDVYFFSRGKKHFVKIHDDTVKYLLDEIA
ncbi:hypothetical protein CHUAL_001986 [Chamberlinius hualienensis]